MRGKEDHRMVVNILGKRKSIVAFAGHRWGCPERVRVFAILASAHTDRKKRWRGRVGIAASR